METVSILGTEYTLRLADDLEPGVMGKCDSNLKVIYVLSSGIPKRTHPVQWHIIEDEVVLHHEIVHAYLNECGLRDNTKATAAWAKNEEMVDWFAIMGKKVVATFEEADKWLEDQWERWRDDLPELPVA